MKKKIFMGIGVALVAVAALPMFSAFEAHVINVTAQIENALQVTTEHIDFGTVFPQEHLEQPLDITLSRSFIEEDRVDDVEYIIRQKPKCGVTTNDGTVLIGPTATGHVSLGPDDTIVIDCGPDPREKDTAGNPLPIGSTWGVLPSLCEYISKEDDKSPDNDGELASFHQPWTISGHQIVWNDVHGRLAKSDNDIEDTWTIDLAVPCFGGFCAQDWDDFVHGINPDADPDLYTQPIGNEHKVYGCDLWVEVTEVSERGTPPPPPEPGTITVTKVVDGIQDFVIEVGDFDLFVGAEPVVSGTGESFAPGSYVISESENAGFPAGATYDTVIVCDDPEFDGTDTVTLQSGENISCTITNSETDGPTTP